MPKKVVFSLGNKHTKISREIKKLLSILIELVKFKKQGQISNKSGNLIFPRGKIVRMKIDLFV